MENMNLWGVVDQLEWLMEAYGRKLGVGGISLRCSSFLKLEMVLEQNFGLTSGVGTRPSKSFFLSCIVRWMGSCGSSVSSLCYDSRFMGYGF